MRLLPLVRAAVGMAIPSALPSAVVVAMACLVLASGARAWPFSASDWMPRSVAIPDWGYRGQHGPGEWDGLRSSYQRCGDGQAQSPIDLHPRVPAPDGRLSFHYRSSPLSLANNGRFIWGDDLGGSYLMVNDRRFDLAEYRFRTPSEHRLEGRGTEMELQLVHHSHAGVTAIVAVFVEAGRRPNSILHRIAEHLPPPGEVYYGSQVGINPLFLLPSTRRYLSYRGSLTTPPCNEGVEWIVMSQPIEVDAMLIGRFRQALGENARPLQPANGRPVFFHWH